MRLHPLHTEDSTDSELRATTPSRRDGTRIAQAEVRDTGVPDERFLLVGVGERTEPWEAMAIGRARPGGPVEILPSRRFGVGFLHVSHLLLFALPLRLFHQRATQHHHRRDPAMTMGLHGWNRSQARNDCSRLGWERRPCSPAFVVAIFSSDRLSDERDQEPVFALDARNLRDCRLRMAGGIWSLLHRVGAGRDNARVRREAARAPSEARFSIGIHRISKKTSDRIRPTLRLGMRFGRPYGTPGALHQVSQGVVCLAADSGLGYSRPSLREGCPCFRTTPECC